MDYTPPLDDIRRTLRDTGLDELCCLEAHAVADVDTCLLVIDEFARFAAEVIAPTDRVGDREGVRLDAASGSVSTPAAFADVWRRYVDGGFGAITASAEHGGGSFPYVVGTALQELFASANLAFSLCQILTHSAVELLEHWGSADQQARYLPKLVTGEWTGTMCLTEPDAGSDVGALRTTATPNDDGTWRLTGQKIFITWGEHDLVDNIVHLVLARTPGAPPGTNGISLFLVPKVLADGQRNALRCLALEHKLGIHASPTCVMGFDGAVGELVGDEHGGMRAMFTMMNAARLAIGVEGLATGELAWQQALAYARERRQGRAPGAPPGTASPIIEHPDVQRMLVDLRASTRAMRLLLYTTAAAGDHARHDPQPEQRAAAQRSVDLLTPIAKAWCTDTGFRLASVALQVHGGSGYIEETGIAQRLRDSRIAPIYEGTNGIQAIDLVTRKVGVDDGRAMWTVLGQVRATIDALDAETDAAVAALAEPLREATDHLAGATEWVLAQPPRDVDVLAGATAYLQLAGDVIAGWLLAGQALRATQAVDPDADALVADAAFFATDVLPHAAALRRSVAAGASRFGTVLDTRTAATR